MTSERDTSWLDSRLERDIAAIAREEGATTSELLRAAVQEFVARRKKPRKNRETAYAALKRLGLIGCFSGPSDLSTNKRYMRGFGRD